MTADERDAVKREWTPLAGNDTNGPFTRVANIITALVAEIESLLDENLTVANINDKLTAANDALQAKLDSYQAASAAKTHPLTDSDAAAKRK